MVPPSSRSRVSSKGGRRTAHGIRHAREKNLDLVVVERCRMVRQVAVALVMEVLQIVARVAFFAIRSQNFGVGVCRTPTVDFGHLPRKYRMLSRMARLSVMFSRAGGK